MPRDFSRSERVADALQRELAVLVREMRDPRVELVNITAVEVSRDLSVARVYVNYIAEREPDKRDQGIAALNRAGGFLRSQLAQRVKLRVVPELRFCYDDTGRRGESLSALIDFAVANDRKGDPGDSQ